MDNSPNDPKNRVARTARPQAVREIRQITREGAGTSEPSPFQSDVRAPSGSTGQWQGQGRTPISSRAANPGGEFQAAAFQERPRRVELPRDASRRPPSPARKRGGGGPAGDNQFPLWTVPVIMVCLGLLAVAGWFVQSEYARYTQYLAIRDKVNRNVFYQNTFVDGVDVSGKTMAQAEELLREQTARRGAEFSITVAYGGQTWRIDSSQVLVGAKYESALRFAYAYGRSGSMQQRYSDVRAVEANGMHLTSEWGYDRLKVRELTDQMAASIDQPASDARLTAFDPNTKAFVFEPEHEGVEADADRLYVEVTAALDAKQYDATIPVQVSPVQPKLRQADIASLFGRVAGYATATTKDQDRNTNISLSAQAINGRVVLPGDTMSFNECTGQRTSQKGYREAGAISGGQLIDATGGGVCQTSSTLFNAVVRADLEIVDRTQHSWPSTYVPRGEDAAVDWPRLDFKFRNNSEYPLFIVAWYADQKVTVEVYGKKLPQGRTIELSSTTIKETKPSNEVIYTRSLDLAPNTQKVAKEKRTGYVVDTYKVYYQDGVEVERKKLWRTEYKPVQKEIYFN